MADVAPHKLTSNTAPAPYVASSSSEYSGSYSAWHAFDGFPNTGGFWAAANGVPTGWIQIRLGKSEVVTSYGLAHNEAARCPRDFTLQGSDDGKSWRVLDRRVGEKNWTSAQRIYQVRTPDRFLYYRIDITANNGDGLVAIGEIYLYSDPSTLAPSPLRKTRFLGSETPSDLPPHVDAGPDQYCYLNAPYVVTLTGSSPDTVTYLWTKVSGPGTATFVDDTDPTTTVTLSMVGTYVLRLTADDGSQTTSRTITITLTQQAATRVSQAPLETLLTETTVTSRVSQGPVEVLMTDDANPARVTQIVVETLQAQSSPIRVTQLVAEILTKTPEPSESPSVSPSVSPSPSLSPSGSASISPSVSVSPSASSSRSASVSPSSSPSRSPSISVSPSSSASVSPSRSPSASPSVSPSISPSPSATSWTGACWGEQNPDANEQANPWPQWGTSRSGSVTQANMTLVFTAGAATADFNLPFALSEYLGQKLTILDSASKRLTGFIKSVGAGTSVNIVSSTGGVSYNWESEESGFNRDDAGGYTYTISGLAEVTGDANWGRMVVEDGSPCIGPVVEMGDADAKTITAQRDKYATGGGGTGTVTIWVRGSATWFLRDDVSPSWEEYTVPISRAWRYAQWKLEYAGS